MSGNYPPAPQTPYSAYGYMQTGQRRNPEDMRDQLAQQILGQPATTVAGGVGQMFAGAGMGLRKYMDDKYPAAPGGNAPSFMTNLANLFTGGRNGGLY